MSLKKAHGYGGLVLCLVVDFLGMATYALPMVGEAGDVVWAPISAMVIWLMFRSAPASIIGLIEEALPGTDFIPTATICWIMAYLAPEDEPQTNSESPKI